MQTVGGLLRERQGTSLSPSEAITITLADGDALAARLYRGARPVIVYLFHGLSGHADAGYVLRAASVAKTLGYSALAVNNRGFGEGRGLAREIFHAGRWRDFAAVVTWGRRRFPAYVHVAVAFSISGNPLLLWLSQDQGAPVLPDAAMAVNPVIDLERAARRLSRGVGRIYNYFFVRRLRQHMYERRLDGRPWRPFPRLSTVHCWDARVSAPAGGFRDREDYYARASARLSLHRIVTPTVVLTARDDPFVDADALGSAAWSDAVYVHIEEHGGHLGYISRDPRAVSPRWIEAAYAHFFEELAVAASAKQDKKETP